MTRGSSWTGPLAVESMLGRHGESGDRDGPIATARLYWPGSVAVDEATGAIAIADFYNQRIRWVEGGLVRTIADITAEAVFIDGPARRVLVSDYDHHKVVAVDPVTRATVLVAGSGERGHKDGPVAEARFNYCSTLCFDRRGRIVLADNDNHCLRVIDEAKGEVTTLTGATEPGYVDGPIGEARFHWPSGVCLEPTTGSILVADSWNHSIRRVDPESGTVSTIAGDGESGHADGIGRAARFEQPTALCLASERELLVADYCNHCIRRIDLDTRAVTTIAGRPRVQGHVDGDARRDALFDYPGSLALDPTTGLLIVADYASHTLRRIRPRAAGDALHFGAQRARRAFTRRPWMTFAAGAGVGFLLRHLLRK